MNQVSGCSCGSCGFPIASSIGSCPWCTTPVAETTTSTDGSWKVLLALGVGMVLVGALGAKKP